MQNGDGLVIVLILLVLGIWGYGYARSKMRQTLEQELPPDWITDDEVSEDENTALLENKGYTVLSGKKRIPVHIAVNRKETLQSRLFLDYIVEKEDKLYAVKMAKERKPLEMTGSEVRERLLIYQLLIPQAAGVLYVDASTGRIDRFEFELLYDEDE